MKNASNLLNFLISWWTTVGIIIVLIAMFRTTSIEYNNKKRAIYKENIIVNTNNFYRNVR